MIPISVNLTLGVGALSYNGQFITAVADQDACPDVSIFAKVQETLRAAASSTAAVTSAAVVLGWRIVRSSVQVITRLVRQTHRLSRVASLSVYTRAPHVCARLGQHVDDVERVLGVTAGSRREQVWCHCSGALHWLLLRGARAAGRDSASRRPRTGHRPTHGHSRRAASDPVAAITKPVSWRRFSKEASLGGMPDEMGR